MVLSSTKILILSRAESRIVIVKGQDREIKEKITILHYLANNPYPILDIKRKRTWDFSKTLARLLNFILISLSRNGQITSLMV